MDLTESIIPKSDQLNAEDLLSGPQTVTIREVNAGSVEQPVNVHLVEFPGRPFRPSKTVRRIMVAAWGAETKGYGGYRMTLYRDPDVKFGGMDVGGIRVSHMSGIDKPLKLALTVTRGKRAFYIVQPLPDAPTPQASKGYGPRALEAKMLSEFETSAYKTPEDKLGFASKVCQRVISAPGELSDEELASIISELQLEKANA